MKTVGTQVEAGEQFTSPWRLTAVGSFVIRRSDVEALGGSRMVALPNSTLRIADLDWEPTRDVEGRIVFWSRMVSGIKVVIANNSLEEEQMTRTTKDTTP